MFHQVLHHNLFWKLVVSGCFFRCFQQFRRLEFVGTLTSVLHILYNCIHSVITPYGSLMHAKLNSIFPLIFDTPKLPKKKWCWFSKSIPISNYIPPRKPTCHMKMNGWKMYLIIFLLKWSLVRGHSFIFGGVVVYWYLHPSEQAPPVRWETAGPTRAQRGICGDVTQGGGWSFHNSGTPKWMVYNGTPY